MSEAAIPQSVFDCGLGNFKAAGNYPPTSDDQENEFVSDLTALGAGNQDFKDCASKWANTTTREEFTGEDAPGAMVVTFCRPEVRPPSAARAAAPLVPPPPPPAPASSRPRVLPPPPPPAPASGPPRLPSTVASRAQVEVLGPALAAAELAGGAGCSRAEAERTCPPTGAGDAGLRLRARLLLRYSQAMRPTGFCVPTEVPYSLKEGFPAWTLALGINFGDRWDSQAKCKCKLEQPAEASFTDAELEAFTRDMKIGGANGQSSKTVDCTAATFRMPTFVVEGMYNPNLAARTVLFDIEFVNKTAYHANNKKANGLNNVKAIDYRRSILVDDTLKPNVACDESTSPRCNPGDAAYSSGYGNLYKDNDNRNGITVKGGLAQINIRKCKDYPFEDAKTQTLADATMCRGTT